MKGRNFGFSPMENLPKRAYVKKFTIGERWCLSTREASSRSKGVERVRGVEPPFQPWQGCVITVILHPQFCAGGQNRTGSSCFSDMRAHQLHYPGSLNRGNQGFPSIALRSPLRFRFGDSLRSHPFLVGRNLTLRGLASLRSP